MRLYFLRTHFFLPRTGNKNQYREHTLFTQQAATCHCLHTDKYSISNELQEQEQERQTDHLFYKILHFRAPICPSGLPVLITDQAL